jgi:hypothetical protein
MNSDYHDEQLASEAYALIRSGGLKFLPVINAMPSLAKPIIAETRAVKWLHIGTLGFWGTVFAAAWALIRGPGALSAFFAGCAVYAGWRFAKWTSRVGLAKAAASSPDAFAQLWDVGAFALEHHGAIYDQSSGTFWQDVVHLAAGRIGEIAQRPISRADHLAAIFDHVARHRSEQS